MWKKSNFRVAPTDANAASVDTECTDDYLEVCTLFDLCKDLWTLMMSHNVLMEVK